MLKLPKINKVVAGLTKVETVKKIVLAAALGASLSIAGSSPAISSAEVSKQAILTSEANSKLHQGALLLAPSNLAGGQQQMAQHYSHSSHSSHSSHQSHYSHYSSR